MSRGNQSWQWRALGPAAAARRLCRTLCRSCGLVWLTNDPAATIAAHVCAIPDEAAATHVRDCRPCTLTLAAAGTYDPEGIPA